MTYRHLFVCVCVAGIPLLAGCSLFGRGPKQHTVVDYQSLEPQTGHGADYDRQPSISRSKESDPQPGIETQD